MGKESERKVSRLPALAFDDIVKEWAHAQQTTPEGNHATGFDWGATISAMKSLGESRKGLSEQQLRHRLPVTSHGTDVDLDQRRSGHAKSRYGALRAGDAVPIDYDR